MGLDMYAYFGRTKEEIEDLDHIPEEDYYWRGRHSLHNWIQEHTDCYDEACKAIPLDREVLEGLLKEIDRAMNNLVPVYEDDYVLIYRKNMPSVSEIYAYADDPKQTMDYDREFVMKALAAIDDGKTVYYMASW